MRTIPDAKLKKPPPKKGGEAVWGPASRFTGHLARYTQSGHLIVLQRMTARSPLYLMLQLTRMAAIHTDIVNQSWPCHLIGTPSLVLGEHLNLDRFIAPQMYHGVDSGWGEIVSQARRG